MQPLSITLSPDDTILITYPDGQQIPIPLAEISRLAVILRSQRDRARPVDRLLLMRREFQAAFTPQDITTKGKEVRKKHEDELSRTALRKEREKRARLKRVEKRDKVKEAEKLLALVGL